MCFHTSTVTTTLWLIRVQRSALTECDVYNTNGHNKSLFFKKKA